MDFKKDIKITIVGDQIRASYDWEGFDGAKRSYGKAIQIYKEQPITILQEFTELIIGEISILRAMAPGILSNSIKRQIEDGTSNS